MIRSQRSEVRSRTSDFGRLTSDLQSPTSSSILHSRQFEKPRSVADEQSRLSNFLSRRPCGRMSYRAREDAHGTRRGDDAAVRSVSGAPPCGRKESGDDGGRDRCRGGCDCGGRRGSFAVAQSADQIQEQELKNGVVDYIRTTERGALNIQCTSITTSEYKLRPQGSLLAAMALIVWAAVANIEIDKSRSVYSG